MKGKNTSVVPERATVASRRKRNQSFFLSMPVTSARASRMAMASRMMPKEPMTAPMTMMAMKKNAVNR